MFLEPTEPLNIVEKYFYSISGHAYGALLLFQTLLFQGCDAVVAVRLRSGAPRR